MNVTQCRMARAALDWTLDNLTEASGLGRQTIARFESGKAIRPDNVETLRATFVRHGIEFVNGGKRVGVTYLRKD